MSQQIYKAHVNEFTGDIQTVKEHSENTASLCREFSALELKELMYAIGMCHDIGKFSKDFQERINGANIKVEHSTCGAIVAKERYDMPASLIMQYCIAGHHSGLVNAGNFTDEPLEATLYGRMKRDFADYSKYKEELQLPDIDNQALSKFLMADCENPKQIIDKFAFLTRYCFSCLVDADSIDTGTFCGTMTEGNLKVDFLECSEKVNAKLDSFKCETKLQRTRRLLQEQVFGKTDEAAEVYLMNMPTGSGKTLCSIKFALERAIKENKKRIVYVIPFQSIIDQTVSEFESIFGNSVEILRHQSSFSYEDDEDLSEDYRKLAKKATENWDAPFIVTTAVQFFESLHSNKRGKLRKIHNVSDSIIIFDEAHMMPQKYLQSCLQSISYITKYLNSEAVFLTATMPDFGKLIGQYAMSGSKVIDLVEDKSDFKSFKKCKYEYLGDMDRESLIVKASESPSSLIIVNKKKTAREIYNQCRGKKYHLSTYMAACDRKETIENIKKDLKKLEEDYPGLIDVPEERRITVVSTSLIEAGVDIDMFTVLRELTGLDSILQSGGRCNREGKRENAVTYIFRVDDKVNFGQEDDRINLTRGIIEKYDDITSSESILEYYDRLFFMKKEDIQSHTMSNKCKNITNIPFKEYAEEFRLIESATESVVIPCDDRSRELVAELRYKGAGLSRKLQPYVCSVSKREFESLVEQHVVEDFDTGIWCLTNQDYYDKEVGILFEGKDYYL